MLDVINIVIPFVLANKNQWWVSRILFDRCHLISITRISFSHLRNSFPAVIRSLLPDGLCLSSIENIIVDRMKRNVDLSRAKISAKNESSMCWRFWGNVNTCLSVLRRGSQRLINVEQLSKLLFTHDESHDGTLSILLMYAKGERGKQAEFDRKPAHSSLISDIIP